MPGRFRFLDDIALADMAFDAEGDSLTDLFEAATSALLESLADPTSVAQPWRHVIDLEEPDIPSLLFEWLERLVYLKDAHAVVFHAVSLSVAPSPDQSVWRLHAEAIGAPVDPSVQELRSDVKGITKHLYAVTNDGTCWKARVVLDV
jgi:SHS2 domain-containing protein